MYSFFLFVLLCAKSDNFFTRADLSHIPSGSPPPVIDMEPPSSLLPPPQPRPLPPPLVKPLTCFDTICGCSDHDINIENFPFNDDFLFKSGRFLKAIENKEAKRITESTEKEPSSSIDALSFMNIPDESLSEFGKTENILEDYAPLHIPSGSPPPVIDIDMEPPSSLPPPPQPGPLPPPLVKPPTCFDTICGCADYDINIPPFASNEDSFLGHGRFLKEVNDKKDKTSLRELLKNSIAARKNKSPNDVNKEAKNPEFYGASFVGPPPIRHYPFPYAGRPHPYPYPPPFHRPVARARCASCQALLRERARDLALDDLLIRQTIEIKRKRLRERELERQAAQKQQANKKIIA